MGLMYEVKMEKHSMNDGPTVQLKVNVYTS